MWDIEYNGICSCWTYTPTEYDEVEQHPLYIAKAPVVIPVEYRFSPIGGVTSPPDPRPAAIIDCRASLPLDVVRDIFLTFEGSIGFYILINGFLQIIVHEDFDTAWASSHLPLTYGGLKVSYIPKSLEPTMMSRTTEDSTMQPPPNPLSTSQVPESLRSAATFAQPTDKNLSLKLNDLIEARNVASNRKERFSGRIGLKVEKDAKQFLLMSTHVIAEAILAAKSFRFRLRGPDGPFKRLEDDWNLHAEIWAFNKEIGKAGKIGKISSTFDQVKGQYPKGYNHDVSLIEPISPTMAEDVTSPVPNLGWLNHHSWASLRQQTSSVKFLADTASTRLAKSINCSRPSDILVVGEGIFLNQKAAAGSSRSLKEHDASTWKDLVSRAILYRVYPDFDPPNGHSGTALYADGVREDGTEGPGIVGFQSFVHRSGHVQNYEMEGDALERRLRDGRVAFYGAFEVPKQLKDYKVC